MLSYTAPVPVTEAALQEYLRFALAVAEKAGQVTLRYFRSNVATHNKRSDGHFDPVTEADRAVEEMIRKAVHHRFPTHGLFGEELGHELGNGLTWVVDPIDGTRAFMTGVLDWGLLLALFDGEKPILGLMHQPFTAEFFYGDNQTAYYRRDSSECRLRTRTCTVLADAVIATTSLALFNNERDLDAFHRLERQVKLSRYGGDCYNYAMLAMGHIDLVTDGGMQAYDIQGLMPIIRGAGGVVSTADGRDASMGGFIIAAGCPELHAAALACMATT